MYNQNINIMELNKNSGGEITLEQAQRYVQAFRSKYPQEVKAFYVGINQIENVLGQENCMGLRIYNGYEEKEARMNIVIVGVNSQGNDITSGIILDKTLPCPSYCDNSSPLM